MEGLLATYLKDKEYIPQEVIERLPLRELVDGAATATPMQAAGNARKHAANVLRHAKDMALEFVKHNHRDLYAPLPPPLNSLDLELPSAQSLYEEAMKQRRAEPEEQPVQQLADTRTSSAHVPPEDRDEKHRAYEARLAQLMEVRGVSAQKHAPPPECILLSSHDRDVGVDLSPFDFTFVPDADMMASRTVLTPVHANNPSLPGTRSYYFPPLANPEYDPDAGPGARVGEDAHHRFGHTLPGAYHVAEVEVRAGAAPLPGHLLLSNGTACTMYMREGVSCVFRPAGEAVLLSAPCTLRLRSPSMRIPVKAGVYCGPVEAAQLPFEWAHVQDAAPRPEWLKYGCVRTGDLVTATRVRAVVLDAEVEVSILAVRADEWVVCQ